MHIIFLGFQLLVQIILLAQMIRLLSLSLEQEMWVVRVLLDCKV